MEETSGNEDGELTFKNVPDHEKPADSNKDNEYEVTVRASDGRNYGDAGRGGDGTGSERGAGDKERQQDRDQLSGERDIDAVQIQGDGPGGGRDRLVGERDGRGRLRDKRERGADIQECTGLREPG